MKKQLTKLLLVTLLTMSMSMNVFATTNVTEPGDTSVPFSITSDSAIFNVTVPTVLPLNISSDGTMTYPEDDLIKITNMSSAAIVINEIQINPLNEWQLGDVDDFETRYMAIGTKQFIIDINDSKMQNDGSFDYDPENEYYDYYGIEKDFFGLIGAPYKSHDGTIVYKNLSLNYVAQLPIQNNLSNEHIAEIIFTLDWATQEQIEKQEVSSANPL